MSKYSSQPHPARTFASLAVGASTILCARVAGAGLNYVLQILLARWAGPDHYGAYSYAMAWAGLLSTFSGMGLPQAVVRFIPEYHSAKQWRLLRGLVRGSELSVLLTSSAVALLGIATVIGLDDALGISTFRTSLVLGFALIPGLALLRLQTEMCIARQQERTAYVLPHLVRPLSMMGGAAVIVVGLDLPMTATTAVLLAGAPVLPIWLIQRQTFRRALPAPLHHADSAYDTTHWLRTALPMLLITGFLLLLGQTDLLMIGFMMAADNVGIYKVAAKTASLVLFPLFAVNAVVAPRFAEQYANGAERELQRLASAAAHWIFWSSLGAAVALLVLSGFLLGLFGPTFLEAEPVMITLIAGQLTNAGAGAVGPLLTMTGHQQESAKVYGACALINIALNGIGIYFWGILGAAGATAFSTALWNVGLYRLVVSKLEVYPSVLDSLRPPSSP